MQTNSTINFNVLNLFDAVMAEVEPDLMRVNIDGLSKKYANETDVQKKARAERYAAAYQEWKIRLKKIVVAWKKEVLKYKDQVIKKTKLQSAEAEDSALEDIASSIDSL